MIAAHYERLAATCDALLCRPDASLDWIANPFLHVVSEHPVHLAPYQDLLGRAGSGGNQSGPSPPVARKRPAAIRLAAFLRNVLRSAAGPAPDTHPGDGERYPVLIVSWLVNAGHLEAVEDFYIGPLQAMLAERGVPSVLVLRNQTGERTRDLQARARRNGPCARLILPDLARAGQELALLGRCLRLARQVRQAEAGAPTPLARATCREARRAALSSETAVNLRLHAQLVELCRRVRPALVLTLYEGHAWERCVWRAARDADPSVLCAGYQHTILRPRQHAIRRALGAGTRADPDLILTLGDVTRRSLERSPGLGAQRFLTLGTHRRTAKGPLPETPRGLPAFLVLPEGNESECRILFEFALACARRLPEVRFIFRMHPVLPFERVEPHLQGYKPPPPNVEVSREKAMETDLERAGYLLYRGSSTVLYGILAGLKPFYVACADEMDTDPLYDLSEWRERVTSPEELVERYMASQAREAAALVDEWQRARTFCEAYTQSIRPAALDEALALAGIGRAPAATEVEMAP